MSKTWQQEDTAAALSDQIACSGATLAKTPQSCLAVDGGTAGTTEETIAIPFGTNGVAGYMTELDPGEDPPAGTWTARLDVTTGSSDYTLQEVHLCWWNTSTFVSLGSTATIGTTMNAGIYSTNITGSSPISYAAGHRAYLVWVFDVAGCHGDISLGVTPSQLITTPIVGVGGIITKLAGSGGLVGRQTSLVG